MPVGAHYKSLGKTGRKAPWAGPKKPAGDATIAVLLRMAMVALAICWMPVERALAEQARFPDLTDTVTEGQGVTFGDLVQLVTIGKSDIRHIGGDEWSSPGPEIIKLLNVTAVPVLSSRSDRMVLLLDFDPAQYSASGFVVLALFDVASEPRLLDAADVAFDRWTFFAEPAWLPIGDGGDLLITRSTHFNSSQGYATIAMILLRDDRFELVDTISTLDERACTFERTQQVRIGSGGGEPLADIHAVVTELTARSGKKCDDASAPEPRTRTVAVTYRWDAAKQRYFADSDALDVLERENEQRF